MTEHEIFNRLAYLLVDECVIDAKSILDAEGYDGGQTMLHIKNVANRLISSAGIEPEESSGNGGQVMDLVMPLRPVH